MDRAILLALLGIPILVIIHAAGGHFLNFDHVAQPLASQAHWQSPPQTVPTFFVVERTPERGV